LSTSLDEQKRVLPHRSQQKLIKELILKNKNMIEFNVNYNLQNLNILDRDSAVSARTWDCSLIACGSLIEAADKIMKGEATNAFCAVRPPGHHAGVFGRTK
jgi:acetoin utilization deacetylase AcuC-like enzyme